MQNVNIKVMNIIDIIILAFALALDAMIVSFSYGLITNTKKIKVSTTLAVSFGFFQFIMPVIGWYLTSFIYNYLKIFSKWIVFFIFIYLAVKFIRSAINKDDSLKEDCLSPLCILGLAIATSIDALGAGISLRFTNDSILMPSVLIGLITFINSFFGFWLAYILKRFPTKYIEITGALLFVYLAFSAIL